MFQERWQGASLFLLGSIPKAVELEKLAGIVGSTNSKWTHLKPFFFSEISVKRINQITRASALIVIYIPRRHKQILFIYYDYSLLSIWFLTKVECSLNECNLMFSEYPRCFLFYRARKNVYLADRACFATRRASLHELRYLLLHLLLIYESSL